MSYLVGQQIKITVRVTDVASGSLVDPATFSFYLTPPVSSSYSRKVYAFDGASWTNATCEYGSPDRLSAGVYEFRLSCPYDNGASGQWVLGWSAMHNADGMGHGSGEAIMHFGRAKALS